MNDRMLELEMKYIGVISLLTRIACKRYTQTTVRSWEELGSRDPAEEDKMLVKMALDDCAALFPDRIEVVASTAPCGYSLEPITR